MRRVPSSVVELAAHKFRLPDRDELNTIRPLRLMDGSTSPPNPSVIARHLPNATPSEGWPTKSSSARSGVPTEDVVLDEHL